MGDVRDDEAWMLRAIAVAEVQRPSPNPRVGCVVVKDGVLVAEAAHRAAGSDHAEVAALRRAGSAARGATVYVSLEPCNHHGRTPPCTDALLAHGVARVVVGVRDPNPDVAGGGLERLRAAGVQVEEGVALEACLGLIRGWTTSVLCRRPHVVAKFAMSLDGRIATRTGDSQWITGETARLDAHRLRAHADAVLVGSGTVLADDPRLTPRGLPSPMDTLAPPVRVVLDRRLRTPVSSQLVQSARASAVRIYTVPDASPDAMASLRAAGTTVVGVPGGGRDWLLGVLHDLHGTGVSEVLVEGGAGVLGALFDAGLVDEAVAYVAPRILGGAGALGPVGGQGVDRLQAAHGWRVLSASTVGRDVRLHATVREEPCSPAS